MDQLISTAELSAALELSASTVKRLRAEGVIRGYRFRRQLRFILREVLDDILRAESQLPLRRARGELVTARTRLKGRLGKADEIVEEVIENDD